MQTLILLVLFVIIGYALFRNIFGNQQVQQYPTEGQQRTQNQQQRPQFPTMQRQRTMPRYDDPTIESRGGFGRDKEGYASAQQTPQANDDRIKSRGGFGRDKH